MRFNRSDSYTLTRSLPRLLSEESVYDVTEVPIVETKDYSVIHLTSVCNMSRYNGTSIRESLDAISSIVKKPILLVVNETLYYGIPEYRYNLLECTNYPMQLERSKYTLESILDECIQTDIANNSTKYTDMLLESIDMSGNPNGKQSTAQNVYDTIDTASGIGYGVGKFLSSPFRAASNWVNKKIDNTINSAGNRVLNAMDTEENRERVANMAGNMFDKSMKKMTGAAKNNLAPIATAAAGGVIAGGTIAAAINAVDKMTSGDAMNATGSRAAEVINALKGQLTNLTNRQMQAPPQQQGIIAKLIAKVKNAIASLGRKLGL